LLVEHAFCAVAEGDSARAVALLEEALARCRAAGDAEDTVNRLRDLGVVALGAGDRACHGLRRRGAAQRRGPRAGAGGGPRGGRVPLAVGGGALAVVGADWLVARRGGAGRTAGAGAAGGESVVSRSAGQPS
jgi:hypothetical protein